MSRQPGIYEYVEGTREIWQSMQRRERRGEGEEECRVRIKMFDRERHVSLVRGLYALGRHQIGGA